MSNSPFPNWSVCDSCNQWVPLFAKRCPYCHGSTSGEEPRREVEYVYVDRDSSSTNYYTPPEKSFFTKVLEWCVTLWLLYMIAKCIT